MKKSLRGSGGEETAKSENHDREETKNVSVSKLKHMMNTMKRLKQENSELKDKLKQIEKKSEVITESAVGPEKTAVASDQGELLQVILKSGFRVL